MVLENDVIRFLRTGHNLNYAESIPSDYNYRSEVSHSQQPTDCKLTCYNNKIGPYGYLIHTYPCLFLLTKFLLKGGVRVHMVLIISLNYIRY